jgi:hypothetical protein
MKRLRYSFVLPLLHLFISALLVHSQQHQIWPYLKNTTPVDEPELAKPDQEGFGPMPCYEYRPSVADHFAFFVEFPVGLPLGLDGSFRACNHGLMAPLFRKLRMGAKTGTIFWDILLACGIAGQWWLIGWKIDSLHKRMKPARLWLVPAMIISGAGCLMIPGGLSDLDLLGLVAALASIVAFFTWIFLLAAALVMTIREIFRRKASTRIA